MAASIFTVYALIMVCYFVSIRPPHRDVYSTGNGERKQRRLQRMFVLFHNNLTPFLPRWQRPSSFDVVSPNTPQHSLSCLPLLDIHFPNSWDTPQMGSKASKHPGRFQTRSSDYDSFVRDFLFIRRPWFRRAWWISTTSQLRMEQLLGGKWDWSQCFRKWAI